MMQLVGWAFIAYVCFSLYVAMRAYFLELHAGSDPDTAFRVAVIVFCSWPLTLRGPHR
jgi:hypothetical protein